MIDLLVSIRTDERSKALPETDDGQFAIASFNGARGWVSVIGRPAQAQRWRASPTLMQSVLLALLGQDFNALAEILGFDFSLVAYDRRYHKIYLARGGIGRYRLYFQPLPQGVVVRGQLADWMDIDNIDADGLAGYLVHAANFGAFDTNHTEKTLVSDIYRVPRSSVIEVEPGRHYWYRHDFVLPYDDTLERMDSHELYHAIRAELDATLGVYAGEQNTVEISGGIDSTILAMRLKAILPEGQKFGLSIEYPYYEFRFERPVFIEPVYERLGIDPVFVDGRKIGMFDQIDTVLPHDEPSRASGALSQAMALFPLAVEHGAQVVFNGQGGDQFFGVKPGDWACQLVADCPVDWLKNAMKERCQASLSKLAKHIRGPDPDRPLAYWGGVMLHDGWADRYVAPQMGLRYECGYVSARMLALLHEWRRRHEKADSAFKSAARCVFADELPDVLAQRRGKVAYDGVSMRSFHRNLLSLCALVEKHTDHLNEHGISPKRVLGHLKRVIRGDVQGKHLLMALMSYLLWRQANQSLVNRE